MAGQNKKKLKGIQKLTLMISIVENNHFKENPHNIGIRYL
jgi:hypothetical protein